MDPHTSRWQSADPAGFDLANPMKKNNKGELVAKENFSIIESTNWYTYCSNNPVKYVDPDGEFVVMFGASLSAGACTGATGGAGTFISYNKNEGLRIGYYSVTGGGSSVGASISAMIDVSFSAAKSIDDVKGASLTVGGSAGSYASFGIEVVIPLNGELKNMLVTISGGVSSGLINAEGHAFITKTDILAELDLTKMNSESMKGLTNLIGDMGESLKVGDVNKLLEQGKQLKSMIDDFVKIIGENED